MEATGYTTLTRQSSLMNEMRVIANNIANSSTTGFRQEGLIFSEYVAALENAPSLSMARANVRNTSYIQGELSQTNGNFDLAIEGDGFFLIETPNGDRLTRAGNFAPNSNGDLVTAAGYRVLDSGGGPVFIPPNSLNPAISSDGTISIKGRAIAQIGVYVPSDEVKINREDGVLFRADGPLEIAPNASVAQGFLEDSNVNPIHQIARMIEVQRAYEFGQNFTDSENDRLHKTIDAFFRS